MDFFLARLGGPPLDPRIPYEWCAALGFIIPSVFVAYSLYLQRKWPQVFLNTLVLYSFTVGLCAVLMVPLAEYSRAFLSQFMEAKDITVDFYIGYRPIEALLMAVLWLMAGHFWAELLIQRNRLNSKRQIWLAAAVCFCGNALWFMVLVLNVFLQIHFHRM